MIVGSAQLDTSVRKVLLTTHHATLDIIVLKGLKNKQLVLQALIVQL